MKKAVDNIAEDKLAVNKMKTGTEREKDLAFTSLYNRYSQLMLFHIMRSMKGDRMVAEDLSQEIFAKAYQNINQYDGVYAFSTWLFNIAKNHIIDTKRKTKIEVLSLENLKTSSDDGEDTTERLFQLADSSLSGNTMDAITRNERIIAAREAIEAIKNPKHKLVLITCEYEDLSYEEASKKLDMPLGTVKALLFRAKQEVKEFLAERKFDSRVYKGLSPQSVQKIILDCATTAKTIKEAHNELNMSVEEVNVLVERKVAKLKRDSLNGLKKVMAEEVCA
jgi:RNA polymerase sigma-70 factor (ECF subfamily)